MIRGLGFSTLRLPGASAQQLTLESTPEPRVKHQVNEVEDAFTSVDVMVDLVYVLVSCIIILVIVQFQNNNEVSFDDSWDRSQQTDKNQENLLSENQFLGLTVETATNVHALKRNDQRSQANEDLNSKEKSYHRLDLREFVIQIREN